MFICVVYVLFHNLKCALFPYVCAVVVCSSLYQFSISLYGLFSYLKSILIQNDLIIDNYIIIKNTSNIMKKATKKTVSGLLVEFFKLFVLKVARRLFSAVHFLHYISLKHGNSQTLHPCDTPYHCFLYSQYTPNIPI